MKCLGKLGVFSCAAGGCDLQGHPLVTLSSQRYSSLVLLNPADVIRLLKYLAFLARFVVSSFMELKLAFNTFQTKTRRRKERKSNNKETTNK